MKDSQFIKSIDCRFPYTDPKKARALAKKALKRSPNAVFMVYHELALPGRGVRAPRRDRLAILDVMEPLFIHPLSGLAAWLTRNLVTGKQISVTQAAEAAKKIAEFPGCYNALNLAYFACDDVHGRNEALFESIRQKWEPNQAMHRGSRKVCGRSKV